MPYKENCKAEGHILTRFKIARHYFYDQMTQEEIAQKTQALKGEHKLAAWGNQIRNYVLHPYKLVKDLRTHIESSNPESVLDGHLDMFIEAQLREKTV